MSRGQWMIYGAYGFTGRLIVEEAMARGHRPLLAGRSREPLAELADRTGLDSVCVSLSDRRAMIDALATVDVVLNAAGPFTATAEPMIRSALSAGTSYVDLSGELGSLVATFAHHAEAQMLGLALIPGAGFDVVPSDCLALHLAGKLPGATELSIVVSAPERPSPGTIRSALGAAAEGTFVRHGGELVAEPLGARIIRRKLFGRTTTLLGAPIGDLVTAHRSTGIGEITTYLDVGSIPQPMLRLAIPLFAGLLRTTFGQRLAGSIAKRFIGRAEGESEEVCRLWACVNDKEGGKAEGWIQTPEAYRLTARTSVRIVELIVERRPIGALSPAQACGADFILGFDGVQRHDGPP